jgi:hypothetical protein
LTANGAGFKSFEKNEQKQNKRLTAQRSFCISLSSSKNYGLHRSGAAEQHWHLLCLRCFRRRFVRERTLLTKTTTVKSRQETPQTNIQNKAARQLFEGAKPTLERLAAVSNRMIDEIKELAARENWLPIQETTVMQRRLSALSDRVLALMEEPDEDALLSRTRLDAITSLLKAIDRLKAAIVDLSDEVAVAHDETEITTAFASIDQRIEELAEAYAKKLVEGQSETGAH